MRLDELKKGFWGYKRDSVYQYVALMEEDFSAKLLEKDGQMKKAVEAVRQEAAQAAEQAQKGAADLVEQAKRESGRAIEQARLQAAEAEKAAEQTREELARALRRVSELEASLRTVQAENETLRQDAYKISAAILESQRYAQQMRDETEALERRARADLLSQVNRQRQELEEYAGKIGQLKRKLGSLLLEMSGKAELLEKGCAEIAEQAPAIRLVPFPSAAGAPFPPRDDHGESPL